MMGNILISNSEIPAIFAVDHELRESMVNYRLNMDMGNTVVIEQVFKKLSIRAGKNMACIFNEAYNK